MHHQLLDALSCLPCLHQDFQGGIIECFGYDCREHLPLYFVFRNHRAVLVLCQSHIPVQERQVREVFRQVREGEKVSALLRHLCRFSDSPVRDFLPAAK